jgi:hypothetical protein
VALNRTLGFCSSYGGSGGSGSSSCCDSAADAALRRRFEAMKVTDTECAAAVKSVLCAVTNSADPRLNSTPRQRIWILNLFVLTRDARQLLGRLTDWKAGGLGTICSFLFSRTLASSFIVRMTLIRSSDVSIVCVLRR